MTLLNMNAMKKKINTKQRARRSDGDVTRAHIFNVAGQVFAEEGYANTTSKEICERAKTNIAAINYHFGSRDQLYQSLLDEAYEHYVDEGYLEKLSKSDLSAEKKLEQIIEDMVKKAMVDESWYTRVLARELLDPTPILSKKIYNTAMKKMGYLLDILSDVTKLSVTDTRLLQCVLHLMAPCMVLLISKREIKTPLSPLFSVSEEMLCAQMKRFIFAGLEAEKKAPYK